MKTSEPTYLLYPADGDIDGEEGHTKEQLLRALAEEFQYALIKIVVWCDGPPPSLGWWPASWNKKTGVYRWWDGTNWSIIGFDNNTSEEAGKAAKIPALNTKTIFWTERPASWPRRSRT